MIGYHLVPFLSSLAFKNNLSTLFLQQLVMFHHAVLYFTFHYLIRSCTFLHLVYLEALSPAQAYL